MKALKQFKRTARLLGLLPFKWNRLRCLPRFIKEWRLYQNSQPPHSNWKVSWRYLYPIVTDYRADAATYCSHYFNQDLWAARKIFTRSPLDHVDIGSRLDGFIAHLLTFMDVKYIDIRPLSRPIAGLSFIQADATNLKGIADASLDSISCLHAAEHFGLGRYNDPLDWKSCFSLMAALQRVLKVKGRLYFSVPIGKERVEFNAHRVFSPQTILKAFNALSLVSFSAIGDDGVMHTDCDPCAFEDLNFGCGLFEWTKN